LLGHGKRPQWLAYGESSKGRVRSYLLAFWAGCQGGILFG
jgi:hypothetical protein